MKYKFDFASMKNETKKAIEKDRKKFQPDERLWKITVNDEKKGSAVLRFLPDQNGVPFKKYKSHFFWYEGPNGNTAYSGMCPRSIGEKCPVCDKASDFWKSPFDVDKNQAKGMFAKEHWVANVYVEKDQFKPENEGKVFLYDFGPQIYKMYEKAMFGPTEEEREDMDQDEIDEIVTFVPCDFENGAPFLLKATPKQIGKSKAYTYEKSKFKNPSRIFEELGDSEFEGKIEEIMEKTHDLSEWDKKEKYPTDDYVKSKLGSFLGKSQDSVVDDSDDEDEDETEIMTETTTEKSSSDDDYGDFVDSLLEE